MKLQAVFMLTFSFSSALTVPLQSVQASIQSRDTTGIPLSLLSNFQLFSNYTAASYCASNQNSTTGSLITCPSSICSLVSESNATAIVEFGGGIDLTVANIKGFVALDAPRKLIVVAFPGSGLTIRNWLADFTFIQTPYNLTSSTGPTCTNCWVHSGFTVGWTSRRTAVLSAVSTALSTPSSANYSIIVTGHSIGAAIATLAAAEMRSMGLKPDLYTFGSPRVGNAAYAEFLDLQATMDLGQNFRVTHVNDPVPQLPPTWIGYQHLSPEYWLSTGTATTDVYGQEDVKVCLGVANIEPSECNAATGLIPLADTAHNHYLGPIDECQGDLAWK